jgi:hypothetical protein
LFVRLAEVLRDSHEVYLVDYRDGYMGERVPPGVKFIDIAAEQPFPEDALLVVQSMKAWNLAAIDRIRADTRVFFWTLHPYNLYPFLFSTFSGSRARRALGTLLKPLSWSRVTKMRRLVNYLIEHEALVFMDAENRNRTASFFRGIVMPERYVPVLSGEPNRSRTGAPQVPLRCAWVGRIVDFKVTILAHLIERLDTASEVVGPIDLAIVGDGDRVEWLQQFAARFQRVRITFFPPMAIEQVEDYLVESVDVLFAMGSSALEGASRKIPTVLLDYSFQPISGLYRFRFMYEATGYDLAEQISKKHLETSSSLEELLESLKVNYPACANQCYDRWAAMFSPNGVAQRFAERGEQSTATVGEMRSLGFFEPDRLSRWLWRIRRTLLAPPTNAGFRNL